MYAPWNGAVWDSALKTSRNFDRQPWGAVCNLALQLISNLAQRSPTRIAGTLFTVTLFLVQVASAARAQTFAIFAAHGLDRRREQYLLAQDVFQEKTFALIIADFRFRFAD